MKTHPLTDLAPKIESPLSLPKIKTLDLAQPHQINLTGEINLLNSGLFVGCENKGASMFGVMLARKTAMEQQTNVTYQYGSNKYVFGPDGTVVDGVYLDIG